MGDLAPVLTAIAATIGGVTALVKALPHLRRLGFGDNRDCVREKAELRAEADVWHEKHDLVAKERDAMKADRDEVRASLATALLNLDFARRSGAEARQELDDLRSEIRAKARSPRTRGSAGG